MLYCVPISYALLWFSTLSPHGVVLTAFLASQNVSPFTLALFRGSGALLGAFGVFGFRLVRGPVGLVRASTFHISVLACGVSCAFFLAAFFGDGLRGSADAPGTSSTATLNPLLLLFLGAIVVSRFGLYGFDLGCLEVQQRLVAADVRMRVASVESSLCSGGTFFVYLMSIMFPNPENFIVQMLTSWVAVTSGSMLWSVYAKKFDLKKQLD